MEFRPCIDIHNGKIKQIVGQSLRDEGDRAQENFVSEQNGDFFASFYRSYGLKGGHIILLNQADSPYYEATRKQALAALAAYPGGMQVGGGITEQNAEAYLRAGASHVIVTSYVFRDGMVDWERLERLSRQIGRQHLVLDVSCRKKADGYFIVTDRWQKETTVRISRETLDDLAGYCDEFLVHAVDVEGKSGGIEEELAALLGGWDGLPVTYAGGVHSLDDLTLLKRLGNDRVNVTIGSALDLFGGPLRWEEVLRVIDPDRDWQAGR